MILGNDLGIELYKDIINAMPLAVIVCDIKGDFILWNDAAFSLFKRDLRESPQKSWVHDWGVYQMDTKTLYKDEEIPLARALRGEITLNAKLYLGKGIKEGGGIYVKVSGYPIFNKNGLIEAGIVVCEDITYEQIIVDTIIKKISELESYIKDNINA